MSDAYYRFRLYLSDIANESLKRQAQLELPVAQYIAHQRERDTAIDKKHAEFIIDKNIPHETEAIKAHQAIKNLTQKDINKENAPKYLKLFHTASGSNYDNYQEPRFHELLNTMRDFSERSTAFVTTYTNKLQECKEKEALKHF